MPYSLRKMSLLALLAAMPAFTACEKDEDTKPPHDTTYTFGPNDYSNISPTDKIVASADSSQVRNVILDVNDNSLADSWSGKLMNLVLEKKIRPAFAVSPKVKGKGNFMNADYQLSEADSLELVGYGFTVNQR